MLHMIQTLKQQLMYTVMVIMHVILQQSMLKMMYLFKQDLVRIKQQLMQQMMFIVTLIMHVIMRILHQEVRLH